MLNYMHKFFKIWVVFHTLYLCNEAGDSQLFWAFLTPLTRCLTASKIGKNYEGALYELYELLFTNLPSTVK